MQSVWSLIANRESLVHPGPATLYRLDSVMKHISTAIPTFSHIWEMHFVKLDTHDETFVFHTLMYRRWNFCLQLATDCSKAVILV